ncbi:dTDP-glucose 4,6-dehydratase [Singulisphaera sp. GP187]|uniref:NAD-dependent epimerase/dehydratase family protein n=1 Tax=Singulisphaera sp. GP187 TaxID=1882752 RepID=UPI00092859FA|nr:NAD(P)-dependent oxidoreductase [Singulisphaera sp. GP187]SIO55201.1 dTDP-glucose 4,6-dehydratase [Singulisphaera sp. GP187]
MAHFHNPLAADLDHVLTHVGPLWEDLRGARLFITGGTGFFGCWLLESLLWADAAHGLGVDVVVLTRSPEAFARKAPHLAGHGALRLHEGDIRDFPDPEGGFSHVIHAATAASAALNAEAPRVMFDTIVEGTRRTLDFAQRSGASRFLLTSSGAVYGAQPATLTHVGEDYRGAPDPTDPASAYGEGKRAAEHLTALAHHASGLGVTIARCFAFVGPYLPLDTHFAIGNFLRDALAGGPVQVGGDGTPYRSYQHAADLMVWLWSILLRGVPGRPYNVGSEAALSIGEVARRIAESLGLRWTVAREPDPGVLPARYVPSTARARDELGLDIMIPFDDAIARTVQWLRRPPTSRRGAPPHPVA